MRCFQPRVVEDVVEDLPQHLRRILDHAEDALLLASSGECASTSSIPSTPLIGVRISWLMVARKRFGLGRLLGLGLRRCQGIGLHRASLTSTQ
jgi:hypothetical protein